MVYMACCLVCLVGCFCCLLVVCGAVVLLVLLVGCCGFVYGCFGGFDDCGCCLWFVRFVGVGVIAACVGCGGWVELAGCAGLAGGVCCMIVFDAA